MAIANGDLFTRSAFKCRHIRIIIRSDPSHPSRHTQKSRLQALENLNFGHVRDPFSRSLAIILGIEQLRQGGTVGNLENPMGLDIGQVRGDLFLSSRPSRQPNIVIRLTCLNSPNATTYTMALNHNGLALATKSRLFLAQLLTQTWATSVNFSRTAMIIFLFFAVLFLYMDEIAQC